MGISLRKNLERKTKEQIQGRTYRRMPIRNPTIQLVVANHYTKFEVSILSGYGGIIEEISGKKEKGKEEQIGEGRAFSYLFFFSFFFLFWPIFNSTIQLVVTNLYTKFEVSILNGCGDIFDEKSGEKEKRTNTGKNK